MASSATIRIDGRFCGPPRAGNGGYVSGRLASFLPGGATWIVVPRAALE